MPKKTKKNKVLTKAEEKLAKYKRGLTTSTLAAEAAPILSYLMSSFFDKGGQAKTKRGKVDKGKELANKIMPFNSKVKFRKEGINLVPVFPKGYKPPVSKMPKYKQGRKYIIQALKKGGSVTVPTKLGRTKKTKIY